MKNDPWRDPAEDAGHGFRWPLKDGIAMLQQHRDMPVERLITAKYPLGRALEAFNRAQAPGTPKVLIEISKPSGQTGRRAIVAS
jgi:hypothetical protein